MPRLGGRGFKPIYLWQPRDELIGKGFTTGFLHEGGFLLLRCVFPNCSDETVLDVLLDGVVKEEGLLLDEPDLRSPPSEVHFFQVDTSASYPSVSEVVRLYPISN